VNNQIQRNYLEIKSISELIEAKKPLGNLHLEKVELADFQLNKFFYKEIGKKHRWIDRLTWNDKNWTDYINSTGVFTYILKNKENLVGYFEQNISFQKDECEIAYFGILEEYIGKKIGAYLLSEAIKKSFKIGSKRIWVHTCSLDHKHALDNYLSRGMKIFKSENLSLE
jgi:GNAT superfamily N-acetyltransferase